MSHINSGPGGRISVKRFARVPAISFIHGGSSHILNAINRPARPDGGQSVVSHSVSSHASGIQRRIIERAEPCFVTKSIQYMHDQTRWVNAVRERKADVENFLVRLGIIYPLFNLDHSTNIAHLDPFVHKSLEIYAFIAVTASIETFDAFINLYEQDIPRQQQEFDDHGTFTRRLDFNADCFRNPKYELVVLHPEHFLPAGSVLTIYDHTTASHKSYIPSQNHCLREYPGNPDCPRLPAFEHIRDRGAVNPLLVIINAEIKFRRYRKQLAAEGVVSMLPADVEHLIDRTLRLVDLIYWLPTGATPPSFDGRRSRRAPFSVGHYYESPEGDNNGGYGGEGSQNTVEGGEQQYAPQGQHNQTDGHRTRQLTERELLEARKAYGRTLMFDYYDDYDPQDHPFVQEQMERERVFRNQNVQG